ncbi:MAG: hypothetical protein DCC55_04080 [Chloroflexi bacterium]|nr:MAG: hypothetical protein DCC55_04080 [Chloroflexota bacterium]
MQFYLALFFTASALVTSVLHLWPVALRVRPQPQLYAPLTLALVALVALLAPEPVALFYKGAITFGLLLALLALLFLTLPGTPSAVGFAHLLIVFFVYFLAFAAEIGWRWPTPGVVLVLGYAALIYWLLAPHLAELWGTVAGYLVLLSAMLWAALEMWAQAGQTWALLGLAGALLLVIAGSVLAIHTWRSPFRHAQTLATLAFYAGHGLVAWSAWGGAL